MTIFTKTIIAEASPRGRGAISIMRLSGRDAKKIALKVVNKNSFKQGRELCWLFDKENNKFEQALLLIFTAPKSFTGEDLIEFHCHGNPLIVQKLIETCLHYGADLAGAGEFSQRAFLNEKMDLIQAESIMDLISAKSSKLLKSASGGLNGELQNKINNIKLQILQCLGLIHGPLDFPIESEEIEIDLKQIEELLIKSKIEIQKLINKSQMNNIFRTGLRAVILGRPNIGKSSLLNLLLQEERAIVSSEAGTTRDFLMEEILIKNIPITFIDTAGLRENTENKIEKIGIQKALDLSKTADLILFVFSGEEAWTVEDEQLFNSLAEEKSKIIILANKSDLLSKPINTTKEHILISAKTGEGLKDLENAIYKTFEITEIEGEFEINLNQRQMSEFIKTLNCLEEINLNLPIEFASIKMEESLNYLEQALGNSKFSSDKALNAIFANFCIGK